ncbi:MAG: branched-chain amino acid aminotransferase [Bifidobacteriaceae bacterium]|jgi:branched-chain amino acid aminotransferase|nr:branched-chain amino acid aminotransferase [Bifidobacteriaceae bacterium]
MSPASGPLETAVKGVPPFAFTPNPSPRTPAERAAELADPAFGVVYSDHMARITWDEGQGWHDHRVVPFANLELSPAASVLHYAGEIFEGLKVYRHADGSLFTFRPYANAARFARSARRMALPELPEADFVASLQALTQADAEWVPSAPETSLYLRPFMLATEPFIGVRPSHRVEYIVIASPVGSYFKGGVAPVSIWVEKETHRAGVGGTGAAKTGGNYAAAMLGQENAYAHGCEQVLFLDSVTSTTIEELGGMNVFVVYKDGSVATPPTSGTILEGVTRSSIIQLLRDRGLKVSETPIKLAELVAGAKDGSVAEVFACGTAAVVTPVKRLAGEGFDVPVADGGAGELTMSVRQELTDIQYGRLPDPHEWTYRLV